MKPAARVRAGCIILTVVAGLQATPGRAAQEPSAAAPTATNAHRVYSHLLEPREHPDYDRRAVKPPTWETFKNRTQFTCLRGFGMKDDQLVGFAEEIEKFTRTHELGNVIWPSYSTLFATNLSDLADEIKRRDLYLFDIWGYVPGSGPGGYWQHMLIHLMQVEIKPATKRGLCWKRCPRAFGIQRAEFCGG
jgi:hypothetical protein